MHPLVPAADRAGIVKAQAIGMPGRLVGDGPEAADKEQSRIRGLVLEVIVQLLRIDSGGAGDRPLLKPPVLRADVDQLAALGEGLLHKAQ